MTFTGIQLIATAFAAQAAVTRGVGKLPGMKTLGPKVATEAFLNLAIITWVLDVGMLIIFPHIAYKLHLM